jgi:molybdenum cofactor cytidylyltransferase
MNQFSALILSAGYSSRMPAFKPLLPVGDTTAVERAVRLFQKADAADICVVTGHNADQVRQALGQTHVTIAHNPDYAQGMFSSVLAGLSALDKNNAAFFVLPVDIPLVRLATVRRLADTWSAGQADILYPVFTGRRGHPPLIRMSLARKIQTWTGDGGLRGFLHQHEDRALEVQVADQGILLDMDTWDRYEAVKACYDQRHALTREECRALMETVYALPAAVISHCKAVADLAVKIARALNKAGAALDIDLVRAAGLVHDIARADKDHAAAGAQLLTELGYPRVAAVVAVHMDMPEAAQDAIDERHVVHLADKMVSGDQQTDLSHRFEKKLAKYGDNPNAVAAINRRREKAFEIKARIEDLAGRGLEDIVADK